MKDTPVITAAKMMAGEAHKGQTRKYSGLPYIVHPIEVATIVSDIGGTDEMIAAALLHDVVEDCPGYTIELIAEKVDPTVADYVRGLTDVSKPEDGNRKTRKAIDRDRLIAEGPEVQTIKYADIISNAQDIFANDPNFAKVYIEEMKLLLADMNKGDPGLYAKTKEMIDQLG